MENKTMYLLYISSGKIEEIQCNKTLKDTESIMVLETKEDCINKYNEIIDDNIVILSERMKYLEEKKLDFNKKHNIQND